MLQAMGSRRVGHDLATEQQQQQKKGYKEVKALIQMLFNSKGVCVTFWGLSIDRKKKRTKTEPQDTACCRDQIEEDGPARNCKGIVCEIEG